MKEKILLFITLLFSSIAFAQTTYVPDDAFEARLIQLGLDSGPLDNFVFTANISSLENLNLSNSILTDITGLQDFTSLKDLRVSGPVSDLSPIENLANIEELSINNVTATSLDLSAFVNLEFIYITDTALTSLDFSSNSNLLEASIENSDVSELILSNNPLLDDLYLVNLNITELDLSSCTALYYLTVVYCDFLVNANLTQNTLLEFVRFSENPLLPFLDFSANTLLSSVEARDNAALETVYIKSGNNTNIGQTFQVRNNPLLTCVEVDDVAWSTTSWGFNTNYFTGFSQNCTPQNDDCVQATSITLAEQVSDSTNSATNSTNSPSCQEAGITILDIWYQFTAPASGSVTMNINASSLTAKMALYASCTDATPLFCAEGELLADNLIPNATYYLQVWLEVDLMNRQGVPENTNGGFVLNVQDTTTLSLNETQNIANQIQLYPNPAKDRITITAETVLDEVSIYEMSGKRIFQKENIATTSETLQLETIASGLYVVQIKTANTTIIKKLLIN